MNMYHLVTYYSETSEIWTPTFETVIIIIKQITNNNNDEKRVCEFGYSKVPLRSLETRLVQLVVILNCRFQCILSQNENFTLL